MSKDYIPTDQMFSSTSTAHSGDPNDSDTGAPTLTPQPNRGVGKIVVTLNGGCSTSAEADPGLGNSANASAFIEWNKPGSGWTIIDSCSSAAANGGTDDDTGTGGPYVVEVTGVTNLDDIENRWRCRTTATSNSDATSTGTASITDWTITVNLKSSGILAA